MLGVELFTGPLAGRGRSDNAAQPRAFACWAFAPHQSNTRLDLHFKLARDHNKRHWISEFFARF
jgi:hypothetical protein